MLCKQISSYVQRGSSKLLEEFSEKCWNMTERVVLIIATKL